jgi:hypothetical protein
MKVRGTIKKILIITNQTKVIKVQLDFFDKIKLNDEMVIFQDEKPEKLDDWKNKEFDLTDHNAELLYSLMKEKQLIEINFSKIKNKGKNITIKINSLVITNE